VSEAEARIAVAPRDVIRLLISLRHSALGRLRQTEPLPRPAPHS
jgi:hypothetical protein